MYIDENSALTVNKINIKTAGILEIKTTPNNKGNLLIIDEIVGNLKFNLISNDFNKMNFFSSPVNTGNYKNYVNTNGKLKPDATQVGSYKYFGAYENSEFPNWDKSAQANEDLFAGRGFSAGTRNDDESLYHIGSANIGDVDLTFNKTNDDWYFIGNPYTSGIEAMDFIHNNINSYGTELIQTRGAIYGFDNDDSDLTGNRWSVITLNNSSKIIPPTEAFFTNLAPKPSTIDKLIASFKSNSTLVDTGNGFKSNNENYDLNTEESFYITLTNGTQKSATQIFFNDNSSEGIDLRI